MTEIPRGANSLDGAAAATKGKKSVDRKSQQILGKNEEELVSDSG